jgi:hypothetical protein
MIKSALFNVYGVILQNEFVVGPYGGPCVKDEYKSTSWRGLVWRFIRRKFDFINGGTVYRMVNIRRVSTVQEYAGEWYFARVAKNMHYTLVFPRRPEEQRLPRLLHPRRRGRVNLAQASLPGRVIHLTDRLRWFHVMNCLKKFLQDRIPGVLFVCFMLLFTTGLRVGKRANVSGTISDRFCPGVHIPYI